MPSKQPINQSSIDIFRLDPVSRSRKKNISVITETQSNSANTILNEIPIAKLVIDSNVSLTSFNSAITYDDILLSIGEVVFLVAQTDTKENGVYFLQDAVTLSRLTGYTSAQFMLISVGTGNKYGGTIWQLQSGSVIGTDNLVFIRLTSEVLHNRITATTTLTTALTDISGTEISVKANQRYIMEGQFWLNIIAPNTLTNYQLKVSVPTGSTVNGHFFSNQNSVSSTVAWFVNGNSGLYDMTGVTTSVTINNLYFVCVNWRADVTIGATAGTLKIQGYTGTINSVLIQAAGYNQLTKVY
jgi:hypothetical protein